MASIIAIGDSQDCATVSTSITAVVEPTAEMGREAAQMLQRILNTSATNPLQPSGNADPQRVNGDPLGVQSTFVPAEEIRFRSSTTDPSVDPSVAIALSFIRENAASGINVNDVVTFLDGRISRVTFERHFKQTVGVTPGEEIRRVRMSLAQNLLRSTAEDIAEVARQCGFGSASSFSSFFRNGAGVSPSAFRRNGK